MSRWRKFAVMVRLWGAYFLYFVVMGVLGVASAQMGTRLTEKVVASASKKDTLKLASHRPRALTRVEQNAGLLIATDPNATHSPARPAVAMVRPDIHPADLAAAMDRSEAPQFKAATSMFTVAACDVPSCNPARVKGWQKSAGAKQKGKSVGLASQSTSRNAGKNHDVALATSKPFAKTSPRMALITANTPPKPSLLASLRPVSMADTPGDIIRLSLLN